MTRQPRPPADGRRFVGIGVARVERRPAIVAEVQPQLEGALCADLCTVGVFPWVTVLRHVRRHRGADEGFGGQLAEPGLVPDQKIAVAVGGLARIMVGDVGAGIERWRAAGTASLARRVIVVVTAIPARHPEAPAVAVDVPAERGDRDARIEQPDVAGGVRAGPHLAPAVLGLRGLERLGKRRR